MKKPYLNPFFYFISCLLSWALLLSCTISAEASFDEYTIESYHIDMVVREDNTFVITEEITAYFNVEKHGIFRKIPLKNNIVRIDGTKSNNKAQVTDVSASESAEAYYEDGYLVVKIGSADRVYTGSRDYEIQYTYNIGKDPLKDADELYFNLIGEQWDTSISDISFTITMPKDFDASSLGFSSGYTGSTDSSNVLYTVDGRVIEGSFNGTLHAGEALTVRLTLPEGYFTATDNQTGFDKFSAGVIIFGLVCVLIGAGLWWKYGKDDEVLETVEFYPPEACNPAEAAFFYKGKADKKSIVSLLIYLADKGYLQIEETEGNGWRKQKGFRIIKRKEYYGDDEYERMFFRGLFRCSRGENKEWIVTDSDLNNEFYKTLNSICRQLDSKENVHRVFEKASLKKRKWLFMMMAAIFVLIMLKPAVETQGWEMFPIVLGLSGVGLAVMIAALFTDMPTLFGIAWGGLWCFPAVLMVLPALKENRWYMAACVAGILYIAILVWLSKIMPKRTPFGNRMLGKLKGFKRFLETAEKPQLESLVEQNPEYYYHVLPYTYALGVSDVWMKRFESIALKPPEWYDSHGCFYPHDFNHFMNNTMSRAQSVMSSSPNSDSGSGGSGGGSSGGGSGGGGGGSW